MADHRHTGPYPPRGPPQGPYPPYHGAPPARPPYGPPVTPHGPPPVGYRPPPHFPPVVPHPGAPPQHYRPPPPGHGPLPGHPAPYAAPLPGPPPPHMYPPGPARPPQGLPPYPHPSAGRPPAAAYPPMAHGPLGSMPPRPGMAPPQPQHLPGPPPMRPPVMMQQPPSQRPPPPHHQYMPQPGHPPEPLGSSGPPFHPPAARPPLGGPTGPPLGGYPGYPSGVPTGGPAPSPVPASAPQQSGPGRPDEGPEFESSELQSKEAAAWTAHKATTGQVYFFNTLTNESSWTKPEGFKGEEDEGKQAKPVSSTRVRGTRWSRVECEDGKIYYYNVDTKATSWVEPDEVKVEYSEEDVKPQVPPQPLPGAVKTESTSGAQQAPSQAPLQAHQGAPSPAHAASSAPSPFPNGLHQPRGPVSLHPHLQAGNAPRPPQGVAGPSGVAPPAVPPGKPHAELVSDFQALLADKGVTAFSRWERELPKLVGEPRFQGVPTMKERRALFDGYCKAAPDISKRRAESKRAALEAFQALLAEATSLPAETEDGEPEPRALTGDTTYETLEACWGLDSRWTECEEKLRKDYFEATVVPLRKAAADQAVQHKAQRETAFRALLVSARVDAKARWSKFKESAAAKDKRCKAVPRAEREALFRIYVAEQQAAEEAVQKERQERDVRETEAKKRLAKEGEEAEKRRRKAAQEGAAANYRTLLNEMVKDPEARWQDWRPRLERDPQGRGTNPALESAQPESLFRDHVNDLHKRACAGFVDLMDATLKALLPALPLPGQQEERPPALVTFAAAESLMQEDPRFTRAPHHERERMWRRYVHELVLARDDPAAAARQTRLSGRSSATVRSREPGPADRRSDTGVDKAYDREYLSVDRKRMRQN